MSDESAPAAEMRLADLKPKMRLEGTVKKVELFGAFVDVGVGRDGLLHISALKAEPVRRVDDVVKEGDHVTVWVKNVDAEAGRLDLTMIEPAGLEWNEIKRGMALKGKVVRLEKFGAFVEVGASRPGLIHVSELTNGFVREPSEIVKVGQEVEAVVLSVDTQKKTINLSIKALEQVEEEAPEEQEEAPLTAMEYALRSAMAESESKAGAKSRGGGGRPRENRRVQEDLLARTLRTQRRDTIKG